MRFYVALLSSTSAVCILLPTLAFAQVVAATSDIEEVVVTAQRRAQSLSDVPASVAVLSSKKLDESGVLSSVELSQVTPGLTVTTLGNFTQPSIRGVSTAIIAPGNPTNVAIYVDGVYQTSQLGNAFDLVDLDRIEVLKGPQGVLYGRNATGGAILVTTRKPTFKTIGEASLSYGRFDEVIASGYLAGPVTDHLATSLALQYRRDDGYMRNVTLGIPAGQVENVSARGRALYEPSDAFSALVTLEYSKRDDNSGYNSHILNFNSIARAQGLPLPADPYEVAHNVEPVIRAEIKAATVQLNYDAGSALLTSTTGFRDTRGSILQDPDYSPAPVSRTQWKQVERVLSEELTLSSIGEGRFTWVVGAYASDEENRYDPYVSNGVLLYANTKVRAASAFATGAYRLMEGVTAELGGRYSWERKHYEAVRPQQNQTRDLSDTWTAFTPQASLRWEFAPRSVAWATFSRGFKSGGYNGSAFPTSSFDPETVDGYELGVRWRANPVVSLEAAAFHYDYKKVQVSAATPSSNPGAPTTQVSNAAQVDVNGVDATATITPTKGLDFTLGYAYLDATYAEFTNAVVTAPLPQGGNRQFIGDVSGNRVARAPKHTATLSANYETPISYGRLIFNGSLYYSSGFYGDFGNRLKQGAYEVLNGQVTWALPGDRVRLSLWGRNLTDRLYATLVLDSAFGDRAIYARPRTFGARVEVAY